MKKTLFSLTMIFLFFSFNLSAQKLGDEPVKLSYIKLPSQPLPKDFTTYSTSLYGSRSDFSFLNISPNTYLDAYFKFDGMQRVKNGGHFNMEVSLGTIENISTETLSEDKVKKDKDGKETKWKEYYIVVKTFFPVNFVMKDLNGNVLEEKTISGEQTITYKKGHKTTKALNDNWKKYGRSYVSGKLKEVLSQGVHNISMNALAKYDYRVKNGKYQLLTVKKHDEEKGFADMAALVARAFEGLGPTDALDGVKKEVQPAFEYWKSVREKYDHNDKKEKKIYHAATINMARTAYWLDMLDAAKGYCTEADKCDFKNNRAKDIMKKIEKLEELFALNEVETRRYSPLLDQVVAPDSGFRGGYVDGMSSNSGGFSNTNEASSEGYMIDKAGNKYEGTFVVPDGNLSTPTFGAASKGGVQFHYEKNGQQVVSDLNPSSVKGFSFNGKTYASDRPAGLGAGLMTSGKDILYESLYSSDKVNLLIHRIYYYKDFKADDDHDEFVIVKKANDKKAYNTGDLSFVLKFKKKMAELYSDCPELSQKYLDGELKNNPDDHLRAAVIYTDECK